jgi:hypothetical protein
MAAFLIELSQFPCLAKFTAAESITSKEDLEHIKALFFELGRFVGAVAMVWNCADELESNHRVPLLQNLFTCLKHVQANARSTTDLVLVSETLRACADGLNNLYALQLVRNRPCGSALL